VRFASRGDEQTPLLPANLNSVFRGRIVDVC
jgi:hypothetical protein